jgi:hypothetical protein
MLMKTLPASVVQSRSAREAQHENVVVHLVGFMLAERCRLTSAVHCCSGAGNSWFWKTVDSRASKPPTAPMSLSSSVAVRFMKGFDRILQQAMHVNTSGMLRLPMYSLRRCCLGKGNECCALTDQTLVMMSAGRVKATMKHQGGFRVDTTMHYGVPLCSPDYTAHVLGVLCLTTGYQLQC